MLRISNIKTPLSMSMNELPQLVAKIIGSKTAFNSFKIVKKAVDARSRREVNFIYTVDVQTSEESQILANTTWQFVESLAFPQKLSIPQLKKMQHRPVIIGSGPAGMFAGLILAEAGLHPIILERGCAVPERQKDVEDFWQNKKLNPNSNVQFGEGGAGTFSDGKLMTGIKKDEFTTKVFEELVSAGAPEEILYLAKPHVGTDNLYHVVQNIRTKIVSLGGEYLFKNRLNKLITKDDKLIALEVIDENDNPYELSTNFAILAIGHSARDTFSMLYNNGLQMQPKAFSVGARIEHYQSLINQTLYHDFADAPELGAADYKMSVHLPNGRSAYTFCMCPGGEVVAAASEVGHVVTNGMSHFKRNKANANSALLVGVGEADFGNSHPLQGMYFQQKLEKQAFEVAGGDYKAPAQLVGDFLKKRPSSRFGEVKPTYSCGVNLTSLDLVLPEVICDTLRLALVEMDKKFKNFAKSDSILTGVETRSSSPVKMLRDENFESNIKGLYPCGEGAGYAGGIVSAAVDGIKTAMKICAISLE